MLLCGAMQFAIADDDRPVMLKQSIGKSPTEFVAAFGGAAKCDQAKPLEIELSAGDRIFGETAPIEWENPLDKPPTLFKNSELLPAHQTGEIFEQFRSKRIALLRCDFENGRRALAASLDRSIFYIRVNSLVCASQSRGDCRISESLSDKAAFEFYRAYIGKNDGKVVAYNKRNELTNIRIGDICENYQDHSLGCEIATTNNDSVVTVASFMVHKPFFGRGAQHKLSNIIFVDKLREHDAHFALREELSDALAQLTRHVDSENSKKKQKQELLEVYR